mmetsp:Transcript_5292/g.13219  ORF Transcript_5292/g.13219 Transcript_5292/m.13219 type:complete len:96 (+) Transcript_5292:111-398(+)
MEPSSWLGSLMEEDLEWLIWMESLRRMGSQRASPKDCLINWGFRSVLRTADQRWMGSRWPATMAIQKLRGSQKVLTMDALIHSGRTRLKAEELVC